MKSRWMLAFLVILFSLAGPPSQAASHKPQPLCAARGLAIDVNFARAGARSCIIKRVRGRLEVDVSIRPETTPINPSPWYSVRLVSRRAQAVVIKLDYGSYRHRYHPHVRGQEGNWRAVASDNVALQDNGSKAIIALELEAGNNVLAGQPFDPPAQMTRFLDSKVVSGALHRAVFGQSKAGISLVSYAHTPPNSAGTLIVLTRQHPPEIAGEWAFDAFVEALLGDTELAREFGNRFGILILPILNPDGIAAGYWRSNGGLIDLNRDWGPFTQPETKAAAAHILETTKSAPAFAMIDFHATNRDVIYAQPLQPELSPAGLVDGWLGAWTAALGQSAPRIDRSHNASNANSKTWARINLGIAAITYEVGDTTPKTEAIARARLAAEMFMAQALEMPSATTDLTETATGGPP